MPRRRTRKEDEVWNVRATQQQSTELHGVPKSTRPNRTVAEPLLTGGHRRTSVFVILLLPTDDDDVLRRHLENGTEIPINRSVRS